MPRKKTQSATHETLPIPMAARKTNQLEMRKNVRRLGSVALVFISAWLWPGASGQEPEDRKPENPSPTGRATGASDAPGEARVSRALPTAARGDGIALRS